MTTRGWVFLLLLVAVIGVCAVVGARYYLSQCHGMDACAAANAESHERDTPSEPQ